jgi:hypothetical protein
MDPAPPSPAKAKPEPVRSILECWMRRVGWAPLLYAYTNYPCVVRQTDLLPELLTFDH